MLAEKTNIRRNDQVSVLTGKEKGKTGKVLKVLVSQQRAVVEKLNVVKVHKKPNAANRQGGIVQKELGIHLTNLLLVCPKCNRGVRVGSKIVDGKKQRVCKKCSGVIPSIN
ncbi:MAG: 50S ribosomal protein L24 [Deltaproteobacteria bacterium]|nr:50S ribosomal protein L24 [Deltaproteobacteria bacterium]